MGDKVFKSNIRLKYNYSSGKVGNTVFRPYVYDSSGTSDTFSTQFNYTDMVHPLNTDENGGNKYKLRYDITHQDNARGGKRDYLFFKGTNGVNSMFSASNESMVRDMRINPDFSISRQALNLNDFIILKHDLKFDKGTIKYKDKNNKIYTVEGLSTFSSETDTSSRSQFYGYGQPVHYNFISSNNVRSDIVRDASFFKNNGYSCFMLLVHFGVRFVNENSVSNIFTMYCFVPICYYDLSRLNNGALSSEWKLYGDTVNTSNPYSMLFYITNSYNGLGSGADGKIWGNNSLNVLNGKVKDTSAKSIPDVEWVSPNTFGVSSGSFIPSDVLNEHRRSGRKPRITVELTSYRMSEMSYKYYMYGDGQSLWRGKPDNYPNYRVKWYPTNGVEAGQPNYFLEHEYIY